MGSPYVGRNDDGAIVRNAAGNIAFDCGGGPDPSPCTSSDPYLNVTVSWSGPGSTRSYFGQTFTNGETRKVCPSSYNCDPMDGNPGGEKWTFGFQGGGSWLELGGGSPGSAGTGKDTAYSSVYRQFDQYVRHSLLAGEADYRTYMGYSYTYYLTYVYASKFTGSLSNSNSFADSTHKYLYGGPFYGTDTSWPGVTSNPAGGALSPGRFINGSTNGSITNSSGDTVSWVQAGLEWGC